MRALRGGRVRDNRRRAQCSVACIESDSNTAPFTEGNQIWQSCVKILICLERISTPYFCEKWKSMLTAACQCYIFRTSDLNRENLLQKMGIMKRYFAAKRSIPALWIKVKTQSRKKDLCCESSAGIAARFAHLIFCISFCFAWNSARCIASQISCNIFLLTSFISDMFPRHVDKFSFKTIHSVVFWGLYEIWQCSGKGRLWHGQKHLFMSRYSCKCGIITRPANNFTIPASSVNQILPPEP